VDCSRIHRANHESDTLMPDAASSDSTQKAPPADQPAFITSGQSAVFDPKDPFTSAAKSELVMNVIRKHPGLSNTLINIHRPMAGPPTTSRPSAGATWTPETGIQQAKANLDQARQRDDEMGEAVRDFCEAVMFYLEENQATENAELQREEKGADAMHIKRLMAAEASKH
jgi:hypothetical protein